MFPKILGCCVKHNQQPDAIICKRTVIAVIIDLQSVPEPFEDFIRSHESTNESVYPWNGSNKFGNIPQLSQYFVSLFLALNLENMYKY